MSRSRTDGNGTDRRGHFISTDCPRAEALRLASRLGAVLCDECGQTLKDEYVEDDDLKFCPASRWWTCKKEYYSFGHDEWYGPQYSWLVFED